MRYVDIVGGTDRHRHESVNDCLPLRDPVYRQVVFHSFTVGLFQKCIPLAGFSLARFSGDGMIKGVSGPPEVLGISVGAVVVAFNDRELFLAVVFVGRRPAATSLKRRLLFSGIFLLLGFRPQAFAGQCPVHFALAILHLAGLAGRSRDLRRFDVQRVQRRPVAVQFRIAEQLRRGIPVGGLFPQLLAAGPRYACGP